MSEQQEQDTDPTSGEEVSDPGIAEILGTHTNNPPEKREDGYVVLALGEEFMASPGEQRFKGQFELWIKTNAVLELQQMESVLDPEKYRTLEEGTMAAIAAGKYKWNGSVCRSALRDVPGLIYFLYLLLRRCHNEQAKGYPMTPEIAEQIFYDNPVHARFALRVALGNLLVPAKGKPARVSSTNGTQKKSGPSKKLVTIDEED